MSLQVGPQASGFLAEGQRSKLLAWTLFWESLLHHLPSHRVPHLPSHRGPSEKNAQHKGLRRLRGFVVQKANVSPLAYPKPQTLNLKPKTQNPKLSLNPIGTYDRCGGGFRALIQAAD